MAAQPELGIWPQRRFGTGVGDRAGTRAFGIPPARILGGSETYAIWVAHPSRDRVGIANQEVFTTHL